MLSLELVVAFVFGLVYGSFLNVVILRFDDWISIARERSECPQCKTQLRWYDLVPVVSYLTLRGQCRYCQRPISGQYPTVEILTGLLVALVYGLTFSGVSIGTREILLFSLLLLVIGSAIVIFWHDLREMMIPDQVSYLLLGVSILYGLIAHPGIQTTVYGLAIGVIPIALLVYPSRGRWMGEGDVKLAAALGALVGFPLAIVFLILSFLLGGLYGAIALSVRRVELKTAVPFAPFLIAGGLVTLFWGQKIMEWYLRTVGYGYY